MRLKLIGIVGALLVLTACETAPMDASSNSGMGAAKGGVADGYGAGGVGVGGVGGVGAGGTAGLSGSRNGAGGVIPGSQQDLANNVGDRVFFGYDQTDLSTEARATLERQAAWLKRFGNVTVTVEGHSDERGTREYNLALGDRRANSVKNYLVTQGVAPNRIATLSYGKERPAIGASGDQAWAQNRRGVTVVN